MKKILIVLFWVLGLLSTSADADPFDEKEFTIQTIYTIEGATYGCDNGTEDYYLSDGSGLGAPGSQTYKWYLDDDYQGETTLGSSSSISITLYKAVSTLVVKDQNNTVIAQKELRLKYAGDLLVCDGFNPDQGCLKKSAVNVCSGDQVFLKGTKYNRTDYILQSDDTPTWQYSSDGSTWQNMLTLPGSFSNTRVITAAQTTYYRLKNVSGQCGTSYSNVVKVNVGELDPGSIERTGTCTINLLSDVDASKMTPPSEYRWQKRLIGNSSWQSISNSDAASLGNVANPDEPTEYRRIVMDDCHPLGLGSNIIQVYPLDPGIIGTSQLIEYGTTPAALTSTEAASGDGGAISYQWYKKEQGSNSWTLIPGATGLTYSPGALS
ncbi:MAG: hypothetical protein AAFO69_19160, partial [Bacteroidota bacterium]